MSNETLIRWNDIFQICALALLVLIALLLAGIEGTLEEIKFREPKAPVYHKLP